MAKVKQTKKVNKEGKRRVTLTGKLRSATDDLMERAKDYNNKYIVKPYEAGRDRMTDFRKDPGKVFQETFDDGKEFIIDMKKRSFHRIDEFVKNKKKAIERLPVVKKVDKKVTGALKAVPARVNLPSRTDIRKLTRTVDALSKKMDRLEKNYSS